MSIRTPLARVRGLGSAKSGTEQWWLERVTSVASFPLVILSVSCLIYHVGASRAEVLQSFGNPAIAILFALTIITVVWHMKLGMQVVIEDYVHGPVAKYVALLLNSFYSLVLGAIGLYAILKMSLGS
jgi:succinate dehydrogenase / fumarate reductase, membrane anchor subunit